MCLLVLMTAPQAIAQQWPRFRGPNGSGIGQADVPATWTEADFRWKIALPGVGHGSPVVWGGNVFVNVASQDGATRSVVCVDARTGDLRWVQTFDSAGYGKHKKNSFATSTPAADADAVYVNWAGGGLVRFAAIDHAGKLLWRRDLGPVKGNHGYGVSPIVVGDLVVLANDQDDGGSLIAMDTKTGQTRWQTPRQSQFMTYSTPCVFQAQGGSAQLIFTNWHHGVTSVDPATGKVNWERDVFGKPSRERAIGSPVVAGDVVITSCGFVTKLKHVVALRPAADAGGADEAWRIERAVPHVPTILVVDGLAYLWSEGGIITVVRAATGEELYRERVEGVADNFFCSPVCAGNVIFNVSENGTVVAIAAGQKFKQLGTTDLDEVCRATPAIAGGDMIVRTYGRLLCVKGRGIQAAGR